MDNKKIIVRIFCLIMAALLVLTAFAGVAGSIFSTQAYAAATSIEIVQVEQNGKKVDYIPETKNITITFNFTEDKANVGDIVAKKKYTFDDKDFTLDNYWSKNNSRLTIAYVSHDTVENTVTMRATVTNITHKGTTDQTKLTVNIPGSVDGFDIEPIDFFLPDYYFTRSAGTGVEDEETTYVAATVLESIYAQDKNKKDILEIDEDTEPFTLIVTFLDFGLEKIDFDDIPDRSLSVYLSNSGGFKTKSNLRGEMTRLNASRDGTARFKVEFPNLTYEKGGAKEIEFTVIYEFDGKAHQVKIPATVKQVKTVDPEDEKNKIAPLKPYIIADYSWGTKDIVAGTEFPLTINYRNTSKDINLENIVMTITTPETISIASSSNTVYVASLEAQGSLSHSINLISKPKAEIGSAEITIDFDYQYVDSINKKREEGKTTQKVGIPLTQIDRFAVDPITEVADYAMQNEPFYVTVSFINRGKSPTYNISASVKGKKEFTSASQHFGNLEPGKSDSLELSITPQDFGDFVGQVVISYEDENTNEKEIVSDFTVYVQEPYVPDPNEGMPPVDEEPIKPTASKTTIVLSILGGLFIAAPIGFYFTKKSKSKEGGSFDEDF